MKTGKGFLEGSCECLLEGRVLGVEDYGRRLLEDSWECERREGFWESKIFRGFSGVFLGVEEFRSFKKGSCECSEQEKVRERRKVGE